MSNNSRPYRATITGPLRTTHYDYPSKEERGSWSHTPAKFTTVTSRKPVTRGEPVCWVNVFAESHRPSAHTTKVLADQYGQDRLHCIPVYLPGEGAEPVTEQMREAAVGYYLQHQKDRQRMGELESEVERLKTALTETMAQRDAARAEVARLTAELADLRDGDGRPDWHRVGDGAFARPFGTIRVCRHCDCLVAGGPNACARCAKEQP